MENIQPIIDLVERTREPFAVAGVPAVVVPNDANIKLFADLMPAPSRIKQTVQMHSPDSLLDYYNRYAEAHSAIFVDLRNGEFQAVLDYHPGPAIAGWGDHRARYTCPKTPEWSAWQSNSGTWMKQEDFAAFIERNHDEILQPSGAEMLEIALTLATKTNVDFRRGIRLDNGQIQLTYHETIEGKAGHAGQLEIPSTIKIGLRLFEGGKGYEIEARFSYRVKDGSLVMRYELVRPHKAHETAVREVLEQIKAGMSQGLLLQGTPQD